METIPHLPWEIIVHIFCRLPVKDLRRYRCVSKSCCSLIGSRHFINLHLKHSPESTSQLGFVFGGSKDLCWAALNDLNSFVRLTYPIDIGTGISVHGSCNGSLAIMNPSSDMAIWNPFIRRYVSLPISDHFQSFPMHEFEVFLTGFGHDQVTDDYKFMMLIEFHGLFRRSFHREFKVYSLNDKSWKKIDDFPNHISYGRKNGVLYGNALHWLVKTKPDNSNLILAFDVVTEAFGEIQLPENKCICVKLVNLGGKFCAVMLTTMSPRVEVWEMKKNRVKESWAILFSVPPTNPTPPFSFTIPIAYLKNGDQVLLHDSAKLFVYDIKRKVLIKNAAGCAFPEICDALICMKSLVGLDFSESTWNAKKHTAKQRDDFLSKGFKLGL